jgi:anti-sigma-K factor RskA
MLTCNRFAELSEVHALGALDSDEAAELKRHGEACPGCRRRLDRDIETAAVLALAAPLHVPPPSLRRSIVAAAREELAAERRGAPWWRRLFPDPSRVAWGAASFATLAAVVSAGWALSLQSQLAARPAASAGSSAVVAIDPEYGGMGPSFALERAQMKRLVGSETAPDARGWIYVDPADQNALLVAYKLPPLPPDRAYQLWLVTPGQQRFSGGTFDVDAEGYGWLKVRSPEAFASVARVGITIEPRSGSSGPTGAHVLGGEL